MANKLPRAKDLFGEDMGELDDYFERKMANNLQETIEEIIAGTIWVEDGKWVSPGVEGVRKQTEAILQAFRDVVPEEKNKVEVMPDLYKPANVLNSQLILAEIDGYNQCRFDILKELGGGNE